MQYVLYAVTLLTSSSLLFAVQPMVAKKIQPLLGGTPAVWTTAMVFFQAVLLAGYLYAHLTTKWLGTRRQSALHLVLMIAGVAFLPIAFEAPADTAVLQTPTWWLLGALLAGVGWPVFIVSTSAPLLQKWFSATDHPDAADPYFLYAASNTGSIGALIAYPFIVEPHLGLSAQSTLWMAAYLILCAGVAICAAVLWRGSCKETTPTPRAAPPAASFDVDWRRRTTWVLWAFIPSAAMLAITTHLTTDIAPVPLLWVIPLAIYTGSFIAAFARHRPVSTKWWVGLSPPALGVSCLLLVTNTTEPIAWIALAYLSTLFVVCMAFHCLLADDRPSTTELTDFYLWVAVGGVAGGLFNALVAPMIFDRLLEFHLTLFAAALAIPSALMERSSLRYTTGLTVVAAGSCSLVLVVPSAPSMTTLIVPSLVAAGLLTCLWLLHIRPRWTPVWLGGLVAIVVVIDARPESDELHAERSFFGTHRVVETSSGTHHVLYHGTTIHGAQARDDDFQSVPLTYYYYDGPLGQVFDELNRRVDRHPVAAVGLGIGSLITYVEDQQTLEVFEIDPVVKAIASNPDYFTYLDDCRADCRVRLGDGRLHLERAESERYELVVVDAYSSAAVPVHLLTRQALESYVRALRPGGIVAIHISSPYLDLSAPLAQTARELGLEVRVQQHRVDEDDPAYNLFVDSSKWMLVTTSEYALGALADDDRWEKPPERPDIRPWTDDYANIRDAM